MARTASPNSATSEFFINVVDNLSLDYQNANDPGYAVFGKVTSGLAVVDTIAAVHDLVLGAWYAQPESWEAIGYPGPPEVK